MPDWRIYYDDGSTFGSDQGEPHEAPIHGFICAVGYDEAGKRYIMHGWDFYRYDEHTQQWWGLNWAGVLDRAMMNWPFYAFKLGRTVSSTRFQELMDRAHHDADFPINR